MSKKVTCTVINGSPHSGYFECLPCLKSISICARVLSYPYHVLNVFVMKKMAFCLCENKDAEQPASNFYHS